MILFASHIAVSLAKCSIDNVSFLSGTLVSLIIKNYAINEKKIMEFLLWISVSWFSKNIKNEIGLSALLFLHRWFVKIFMKSYYTEMRGHGVVRALWKNWRHSSNPSLLEVKVYVCVTCFFTECNWEFHWILKSSFKECGLKTHRPYLVTWALLCVN